VRRVASVAAGHESLRVANNKRSNVNTGVNFEV
jgi:hypothetical protein